MAGIGTRGFSGDGGPATLAELNSPTGILVDELGNLFIADRDNHRIRKVLNGIRGDVTLDGRRSILDIIALVRILIGTDPTPTSGSIAINIADMNADGTLDIADVVAQVNSILGYCIQTHRLITYRAGYCLFRCAMYAA